MLTVSMTAIIGQLNAASAALRDITREPTVEAVRTELERLSHELETGYR
jgi:hypothetical protein